MITGSLNALFAATVVFVGGHFLLSSQPIRSRIAGALGERGFLLLYSLVAIASFIWMLQAYGAAPVIDAWVPPAAFRWLPLIIMPVALILAVSGLTTPGPTTVGGDSRDNQPDSGRDPARGILHITRHPFLWGVALWALSHLATNGDAASIILMGGILILALGGMRHIDARREASMGAAWGPIALTTSLVPFAAILSGRTKMDWAGIGWWRPALGLVVYAALLAGHEVLIGLPAWP